MMASPMCHLLSADHSGSDNDADLTIAQISYKIFAGWLCSSIDNFPLLIFPTYIYVLNGMPNGGVGPETSTWPGIVQLMVYEDRNEADILEVAIRM